MTTRHKVTRECGVSSGGWRIRLALALSAALVCLPASAQTEQPSEPTPKSEPAPSGEAKSSPEADKTKAEGETAKPGVEAKPDADLPPARYRDPRDEPADEILLADMKRRHPHLDPVEKHNLRDVQNPTDPALRHSYTLDMVQVIDLWVASGNGAAAAKVLNEQLDEKLSQPVYAVLMGYFHLHWPDSDATVSLASAERFLSAAVALAPDFAPANLNMALMLLQYPQYFRGRIGEAEKLTDAALLAKPDYIEAHIVKSVILDVTRRGEEAKAAAISTMKLANARPDHLEAILPVYLRSEPSNEEARKFLNERVAAETDAARRSIFALGLAEVLMREGKFEDARTVGAEALAKLDPATQTSTILRLQFQVIDESLAREIALLSGDSKAADRSKLLLAQREELLKSCVELDLNHLQSIDRLKGLSLFRYDRFLQVQRRNKDALELLKSYDERATRLSRPLREEIRVSIEGVETLLGLKWPVLRLKELASSVEATDHLRLEQEYLMQYRLLARGDEATYRFDTADMHEFLVTGIAHAHRGIARECAVLAAIGARQANTDESKKKVADAIVDRLAKERDLEPLAVRRLVEEGLEQVVQLQGTAGAVRAARWIEGFGDGVADRTVRTRVRDLCERTMTGAKLGRDRQLNNLLDEVKDGATLKKWADALADKVGK